MEEDADMDAPQISTLREEGSPPASSPAASSNGKLRVKLVVSDTKPKGPSPPSASVPAKRARSDDEGDDEDDQEDQLIDDDDMMGASNSAPADATPAPTPKKKAPVKRKPKKTEMKQEENPGFDPNHTISLTVTPSESVSAPPPAKKKRVEKATKSATAPRVVKPRVSKTKTVVSQLAAEDSGAISEGFTGTAASSPVTMPSPEPEQQPAAEEPLLDDINLENVPIPVYALPTKPFPVQPAPKVATGYAPTTPLDRSGKKVRKWRVANREIRGIAGGRWMTRSWVGEKHSETGTKPGVAEAQLAIPRLPALLGKTKGKPAKSLAGSSRSESVAGDGTPAIRTLTKLRTSVLGPSSDAGDSDMLG